MCKITCVVFLLLILSVNAGDRGSYTCNGSVCGCVNTCVNDFLRDATPMQKRLNMDWIANGCFMRCTGNPCKAECILNGGNSHNCYFVCNGRP
jgi:hypothetical protein